MSQPPPPTPPPSSRPLEMDMADVTIGEVKPVVDKERVSPWNFMYAVERNPCFRQSFMWGIGVGSAMGVHSAIRHRSQVKAINAAVGTFLGVSTGTWLYCRIRQREEDSRMKEITGKMAQKKAAKDGAATATAAAPPTKQ